MDFSTLSANTKNDKPFWDTNSSNNTPNWSNKGSVLFASNSSPNCKNADDSQASEPDNYDPHYEAIVSLPKVAEVSKFKKSYFYFCIKVDFLCFVCMCVGTYTVTFLLSLRY